MRYNLTEAIEALRDTLSLPDRMLSRWLLRMPQDFPCSIEDGRTVSRRDDDTWEVR